MLQAEHMDHLDFQNLFNEKLRERNLSVRKLSELSGITLKHLESISTGHFHKLPAAPYVRGYLIKLGEILDFDGGAWWESLHEGGIMHTSGSSDQLPKNRFAKEPMGKWVILGVVGGIIVLYFALRFSAIFGKPTLIVHLPEEEVTVVTSPLDQYVIRGELAGGGGVYVNAERIPVDANGIWEKSISLTPGPNNPVEIVAKKFLGGEQKIMRQIIYEPPMNATTTP